MPQNRSNPLPYDPIRPLGGELHVFRRPRLPALSAYGDRLGPPSLPTRPAGARASLPRASDALV